MRLLFRLSHACLQSYTEFGLLFELSREYHLSVHRQQVGFVADQQNHYVEAMSLSHVHYDAPATETIPVTLLFSTFIRLIKTIFTSKTKPQFLEFVNWCKSPCWQKPCPENVDICYTKNHGMAFLVGAFSIKEKARLLQ